MKRFISKPVIGVIAAAVVLSFAPQSWAAACSVGSCTITDGALSESHPVAISGADVALGPVDHQGSIPISPAISHTNAFVDIAFDEILPGDSAVRAGFSDLTIEFFQDATSLGSFVLTNPDGTSLLQTFVVSFISSSDLLFEITGAAFRNAGASLPDYNIDLAGVPVPGAFILLLSGLAGLGFSIRGGKKTV
jgi:hypothetical protein